MEIGIKDYAKTRLVDRRGDLKERIIRSCLKEHIIPSCTIDKKADSLWEIVFEEGPFFLSCNKKRRLIFYQNAVTEASEWDILYLVRQVLDRQLNEKGYATLHASALMNKDKAIIISGESGSGKTSLTMAGFRKGYYFVGDESVVVSSDLKVVAGTQLVIYKEAMAQKFFPQFKYGGTSPVPGVRAVKPEELYGENIKTTPSSIGLIINPKVWGDFAIYPSSKKVMKHTLFRAASQYVSGLFMVNGMNRSCTVDIDTPTCREKRCDLINRLVEATPCYRIEGKAEEILERIKEVQELQ